MFKLAGPMCSLDEKLQMCRVKETVCGQFEVSKWSQRTAERNGTGEDRGGWQDGDGRGRGGAPPERDWPAARRVLHHRHSGGQRDLHRAQGSPDEQWQRGALSGGLGAVWDPLYVW